MQAVFIISLFSLLITIVGSIIAGGSNNAAQLNDQRKAETYRYFEQVAAIIQNEITPDQLDGNPNGATNPADLIRGLTQLKLLSSGRWADPSFDAWGNEIKGFIVTQYMPLTSSTDTDNTVMVPVTGYVFVSGGPNGKIDTVLPQSVNSLTAIYNVVVPSNASGLPANDDIIYTFDNNRAQRDALMGVKARMDRIGAAALKQLMINTSNHRAVVLANYQADIAAGKNVNLSALDPANDSSAPTFKALDNTKDGLDNRRELGVDEEFAILERTLPKGSGTGGNFVISAAKPATALDPLVLTITNNSAKKTPWGTTTSPFKFTLKVKSQPS